MHKWSHARFLRQAPRLAPYPRFLVLLLMLPTLVKQRSERPAVNGIADMPGGGRVRISCTNTNPAGPPAAANPGVVVLTVNFGAPISNNQTHPSTAAGIRLINGTGDFVTPGPLGPTAANPGNVGIAAINNSSGQIVIGLGTPGSTVGSNTVAPVIPTSGITFTPGATSTFELAGWLLSTNGKSGAINATLTSTGGDQRGCRRRHLHRVCRSVHSSNRRT